jgi:ACT domain-containing protein
VSDARDLARLPRDVRSELLRVLTSPSNVRADVIRQFHEREKDEMVDVVVELEADELLRFAWSTSCSRLRARSWCETGGRDELRWLLIRDQAERDAGSRGPGLRAVL